MDLIGTLYYDEAKLEKHFGAGFNITGHSKGLVHLVISNINSTHSAEYFCAASMHSVASALSLLSKSWWPTVSYILYSCTEPST